LHLLPDPLALDKSEPASSGADAQVHKEMPKMPKIGRRSQNA
jgi:hypothetical protein